jgi:hypothetical protein
MEIEINGATLKVVPYGNRYTDAKALLYLNQFIAGHGTDKDTAGTIKSGHLDPVRQQIQNGDFKEVVVIISNGINNADKVIINFR